MIEYTVKVHPDRTEWFLNGKLHREDGPAVEWADGSRSWWLNGEQVTEAEVMKPTKELTVAQIEQLLGYSVKVIK
jgi:NADPH-dependent ferric siderophore reductase